MVRHHHLHRRVFASVVIAIFGVTSPIQADEASDTADAIIKQTGVRRGICAVITDDPADRLPLEIARASDLLVHVRCSDRKGVDQLRKSASDDGYGIDRFVVEYGSTSSPLPYATNLVDILVIPDWPKTPSLDEMLRVLRPRGTAFVGADNTQTLLKEFETTGNTAPTTTRFPKITSSRPPT